MTKLLAQHPAGAKAIELRTEDGATPLIMAAREGQLEVVRVLAEAGANLNKLMRPPAGGGQAGGKRKKGKKKKAKPSRAPPSKGRKRYPMLDGSTPLYVAALKGQTAMVELLCELGAKQSPWKKDGASASQHTRPPACRSA